MSLGTIEPKTLFITGYHEDEGAIGREITASYQRQFGLKNTFFYTPDDNRGSMGGHFCDKVEKQIYSRIHILKPDLYVDIHHPDGIPKPTEKVRCDLELIENSGGFSALKWYLDFVESDLWRLSLPPKEACISNWLERGDCLTGLVAEFYICPGDYQEFGHKKYVRRIDEAAQILNNLARSYRGFSRKYESDSLFRSKTDAEL